MKRDKGLEQSFLKTYDTHGEAIFRHCFYRVYDRELARELMQESFTKAWRYIAEGKKVKNIRALVYKIANNLIIDHARKKKEASLEHLMDKGFTPSTGAEEIELQTDAHLLLDQFHLLEAEYREAVYMRYVDGLKPKEIAEITGESPNVISVRIHRGTAQLKTIVENGKTRI